MDSISYEELEQLAFIFQRKIQEEFSIKHLSGNLANTIEIVASDDNIQIIIPAKTYNMLLYQTKGVIVHTSHGSYASKLDKEGSEFFIYPNGTIKGRRKIKPRNHVGFVDKAIRDSIDEWLLSLSGKYEETKITDTGGE